MSRSLKKQPYVFDRLMKRVEENNASGNKNQLKHGLDHQLSTQNLLEQHLLFTTEKTCSCLLHSRNDWTQTW